MASAQAEDGSFPTGSSLSLSLDGKNTSTTFYVIRSFTPFTQGQVYFVKSDPDSGFPRELILKVYDPKFLDDRRLEPYEPWTLAAESLVVQKWEQGQISSDFNIFDLDDDVEMESWHWEAQLFCSSERSFRTEVAAYKRLLKMQGQFIPEFYGCGRLLPTPPESRAIQPRAILIEYIPGVTLRDVDHMLVHPELYRPLMGAVACFDSLGVNHYDINANNIMLAPPKAPKRMVIIDFGFAGVRQEGMTEEEWGNGLKGDVGLLRISLEKKLGIKLDNVGDMMADDGDHDGLRFVLSQKCGPYLSAFFSFFSRLRRKRV